ncbi:hypothetical protein RFI_12845 [Reticulomyxa filosa]|uniref:Uncharacterized protein n=1 Tax=Reticulomyxa filosa TaxID=46433 RepID=X6NEB8_RETFI|nr:hypothetical protein RFI_12845 [Reticulomyxa filosa]|eukprot:ETO24311.1 hypothetical protein RFI_12845 [Reticulomyxa filosa]
MVKEATEQKQDTMLYETEIGNLLTLFAICIFGLFVKKYLCKMLFCPLSASETRGSTATHCHLALAFVKKLLNDKWYHKHLSYFESKDAISLLLGAMSEIAVLLDLLPFEKQNENANGQLSIDPKLTRIFEVISTLVHSTDTKSKTKTVVLFDKAVVIGFIEKSLQQKNVTKGVSFIQKAEHANAIIELSDENCCCFVSTAAVFNEIVQKPDIPSIKTFLESIVRLICFDTSVFESIKDSVVTLDKQSIHVVVFKSSVDLTFIEELVKFDSAESDFVEVQLSRCFSQKIALICTNNPHTWIPESLIRALGYCNIVLFKRALTAETLIISPNTCVILCNLSLTSAPQTRDDIQNLIGRVFRCYYQYVNCHVLLCTNSSSPNYAGKHEFFHKVIVKLMANLSNVFKDFNVKIHTVFYPLQFVPSIICDLIQSEYPTTQMIAKPQSQQCADDNLTTLDTTQMSVDNSNLEISINTFLTEFETNDEVFLCAFPSINVFVAQMILQRTSARVCVKIFLCCSVLVTKSAYEYNKLIGRSGTTSSRLSANVSFNKTYYFGLLCFQKIM